MYKNQLFKITALCQRLQSNSTPLKAGTLLLCIMLLITFTTSAHIPPPDNKPIKILLIQGANMSYLGKRDPKLYGATTAAQLDEMVKAHARKNGYELEIFYTNTEGEAIDKIYASVKEGIDGIVMNPGGFTYGGFSLRDCLIAVPVPYVEVHMLSERDWSGQSVTVAAANGKISGFGTYTYILGLDAVLNILKTSTDIKE